MIHNQVNGKGKRRGKKVCTSNRIRYYHDDYEAEVTNDKLFTINNIE